MGAYVEPPDNDVEGFLQREGKRIYKYELARVPRGFLPVILLDRGSSKSAGIGYDDEELRTQLDIANSALTLAIRYGSFLWKNFLRSLRS
jgi:hypothetical protein